MNPIYHIDPEKSIKEQRGPLRNKLRWYHFGLMGRLRMCKGVCHAIASSPTATKETRELAVKVDQDLAVLQSMLGTRTFK